MERTKHAQQQQQTISHQPEGQSWEDDGSSLRFEGKEEGDFLAYSPPKEFYPMMEIMIQRSMLQAAAMTAQDDIRSQTKTIFTQALMLNLIFKEMLAQGKIRNPRAIALIRNTIETQFAVAYVHSIATIPLDQGGLGMGPGPRLTTSEMATIAEQRQDAELFKESYPTEHARIRAEADQDIAAARTAAGKSPTKKSRRRMTAAGRAARLRLAQKVDPTCHYADDDDDDIYCDAPLSGGRRKRRQNKTRKKKKRRKKKQTRKRQTGGVAVLAAITISKILAGIFALAGTAGIYRMYRNAADTPIGKKEGEEAEETVEEAWGQNIHALKEALINQLNRENKILATAGKPTLNAKQMEAELIKRMQDEEDPITKRRQMQGRASRRGYWGNIWKLFVKQTGFGYEHFRPASMYYKKLFNCSGKLEDKEKSFRNVIVLNTIRNFKMEEQKRVDKLRSKISDLPENKFGKQKKNFAKAEIDFLDNNGGSFPRWKLEGRGTQSYVTFNPQATKKSAAKLKRRGSITISDWAKEEEEKENAIVNDKIIQILLTNTNMTGAKEDPKIVSAALKSWNTRAATETIDQLLESPPQFYDGCPEVLALNEAGELVKATARNECKTSPTGGGEAHPLLLHLLKPEEKLLVEASFSYIGQGGRGKKSPMLKAAEGKFLQSMEDASKDAYHGYCMTMFKEAVLGHIIANKSGVGRQMTAEGGSHATATAITQACTANLLTTQIENLKLKLMELEGSGAAGVFAEHQKFKEQLKMFQKLQKESIDQLSEAAAATGDTLETVNISKVRATAVQMLVGEGTVDQMHAAGVTINDITEVTAKMQDYYSQTVQDEITALKNCANVVKDNEKLVLDAWENRNNNYDDAGKAFEKVDFWKEMGIPVAGGYVVKCCADHITKQLVPDAFKADGGGPIHKQRRAFLSMALNFGTGAFFAMKAGRGILPAMFGSGVGDVPGAWDPAEMLANSPKLNIVAEKLCQFYPWLATMLIGNAAIEFVQPYAAKIPERVEKMGKAGQLFAFFGGFLWNDAVMGFWGKLFGDLRDRALHDPAARKLLGREPDITLREQCPGLAPGVDDEKTGVLKGIKTQGNFTGPDIDRIGRQAGIGAPKCGLHGNKFAPPGKPILSAVAGLPGAAPGGPVATGFTQGPFGAIKRFEPADVAHRRAQIKAVGPGIGVLQPCANIPGLQDAARLGDKMAEAMVKAEEGFTGECRFALRQLNEAAGDGSGDAAPGRAFTTGMTKDHRCAAAAKKGAACTFPDVPISEIKYPRGADALTCNPFKPKGCHDPGDSFLPVVEAKRKAGFHRCREEPRGGGSSLVPCAPDIDPTTNKPYEPARFTAGANNPGREVDWVDDGAGVCAPSWSLFGSKLPDECKEAEAHFEPTAAGTMCSLSMSNRRECIDKWNERLNFSEKQCKMHDVCLPDPTGWLPEICPWSAKNDPNCRDHTDGGGMGDWAAGQVKDVAARAAVGKVGAKLLNVLGCNGLGEVLYNFIRGVIGGGLMEGGAMGPAAYGAAPVVVPGAYPPVIQHAQKALPLLFSLFCLQRAYAAVIRMEAGYSDQNNLQKEMRKNFAACFTDAKNWGSAASSFGNILTAPPTTGTGGSKKTLEEISNFLASQAIGKRVNSAEDAGRKANLVFKLDEFMKRMPQTSPIDRLHEIHESRSNVIEKIMDLRRDQRDDLLLAINTAIAAAQEDDRAQQALDTQRQQAAALERQAATGERRAELDEIRLKMQQRTARAQAELAAAQRKMETIVIARSKLEAEGLTINSDATDIINNTLKKRKLDTIAEEVGGGGEIDSAAKLAVSAAAGQTCQNFMAALKGLLEIDNKPT